MAGSAEWGWESRQGEDGHCLSEEGRGDPWGRTPLEEGVHWAPKVVSACLWGVREWAWGGILLGNQVRISAVLGDSFRELGVGGGPCA